MGWLRRDSLGAEEAAEKGVEAEWSRKLVLQGLKPALIFAALAARLKSCPVTGTNRADTLQIRPERVFRQPVRPGLIFAVLLCGLKPVPFTFAGARW
jgi:hypothetical protein